MFRVLVSARARAVVLAAVAAAAFGATPAYAGTASFSGTITDAVTGDPVAGVCVLVWKEEGDVAYSQDPASCTEADGHWSSPALDAGTYYIEASGDGWVKQYAYGATYSWDAQRFTVADGDAVTVDLAMEAAGAIAGTVTDAVTGEPIADACASAQSGESSGYTCTGSDGTYLIGGLRAASDYAVSFADYSGRYLSASVDGVVVVAGETTPLDQTLQPAASITGTVTDAVSGSPMPGVCVNALPGPEELESFGFACTDENGDYRMTGVPNGDFYVSVEDDSGAHPRTWYPSTTDPATAVAVHATGGQETSGVDVSFSPAAYVTGTVTRAATGEPLADVCVSGVRASDGTFLRSGGPLTCTDENGTYTVGGLPAGDVKVFFGPSGGDLLAQWAYGKDSEATASLVPVVAGETTSGVDAAMVEGGRITGRILDAKTKKPAAGACATVGVYSHRAGENGTQWASACAGPDGTYEIHGLPTGSYTVEFYDPEGAWAWQFFPNKADRVHAARLSVTAESTLSGINGRLVPGGTVEGMVTDAATGLPAEGVCVDAYTGRGHDTFGTTAQTFADGRYVLRGFPSTNVKVYLVDCGGGYAAEWAFDRGTYETATPIATTAGTAVTANMGVSAL